MEEIWSLWQKFSAAGTAGILFGILVAGYFRKWVWGYQLEEMRFERDEWKGMALRGTLAAEKGTQVAEKAVTLAANRR